MEHQSGQPMKGSWNDAMKEHLRREVAVAVEMMIRDNSAFHVFDVDKKGEYCFLLSIVPKAALRRCEEYLDVSAPLRPPTSVQGENHNTETQTEASRL
jgi:hypothetical protein